MSVASPKMGSILCVSCGRLPGSTHTIGPTGASAPPPPSAPPAAALDSPIPAEGNPTPFADDCALASAAAATAAIAASRPATTAWVLGTVQEEVLASQSSSSITGWPMNDARSPAASCGVSCSYTAQRQRRDRRGKVPLQRRPRLLSQRGAAEAATRQNWGLEWEDAQRLVQDASEAAEPPPPAAPGPRGGGDDVDASRRI